MSNRQERVLTVAQWLTRGPSVPNYSCKYMRVCPRCTSRSLRPRARCHKCGPETIGCPSILSMEVCVQTISPRASQDLLLCWSSIHAPPAHLSLHTSSRAHLQLLPARKRRATKCSTPRGPPPLYQKADFNPLWLSPTPKKPSALARSNISGMNLGRIISTGISSTT